MTAHLDRALVLFQQGRLDLAEGELRQALLADPNHPMAHALLALCLLNRKEYEQATDEVERAIHLAPELPFAHYTLACVLQERNYLPQAELAIGEALRLDPTNPQFHATRAGIVFGQKRWQDALTAAEAGLRLDPEHIQCNNLRAMALVKLGRQQEAGLTIQTALARDPEDALSHANMGWTSLEQNDHKKALEHFGEALRLDPTQEWARAGLVEALQARYFIYRIMLRYFLWMAKLSDTMQWAIVIGGYIGFRVLGSIAANNPPLAPYLEPLLYLYIAFAVMTWVARPLCNLLLRCNRYGRYALSRDQIVASNWIGGCVLLVLLSLGGWWLFDSELGMYTALMAGLLIMPLAGTFQCDAGWPRLVMGTYTFLLAATYVAIVILVYSGQAGIADKLLPVLLIGVILAPWVANGLAVARVRH